MLKQQQVIIDKQKDSEQSMLDLEDKLVGLSNNPVKKRVKIPRPLTVSQDHAQVFNNYIIYSQNLVASVHDALDDGFKPQERYHSSCAFFFA